MATLESAYNPDYSEMASILTGKPGRVTVDLEDSDDVAFWKNILEEQCPSKQFHFNPYSTILDHDGTENRVKGKSRIMKMASRMNDWHIGCVDSDYDWLLSDYCGEGEAINTNKYLLQTYSYSFENLLCVASTLNDFCRDVTKEYAETDVSEYVRKVSATIYPLLIWSAYLYSKGNHDFTPTSWRGILVSTLKNVDASLALIEKRVKAKLAEIEANHASEKGERDDMEASLSKEKSITEENAYLFVRGHDLFDHLLNSILDPIITALRKQHYSQIKKSYMDKDLRNAALKAYSESTEAVKDMLYGNYRYKEKTRIYDMICQDVTNIWE